MRSIIENALLKLEAVFGDTSDEHPIPVKVEGMSVEVAAGIFNSDVDKINGNTVDVSSGNKGLGTQRMTLATDDVNTAAMKASLDLLDDAVAAEAGTASKGIMQLLDNGTNGEFAQMDPNTKGLKTSNLAATVVRTATIAQNASLSDEIDIRGYKHIVIFMPAAWDAAALTFVAAPTAGGTAVPVYANGVEVSETVAASRAVAIDLNAIALAGVHFLYLRSGTATAAVNQTAIRTLYVALKA